MYEAYLSTLKDLSCVLQIVVYIIFSRAERFSSIIQVDKQTDLFNLIKKT